MVDPSSLVNSAEQAFRVVPGHTTFVGVLGSPGGHAVEGAIVVGLVAHIAGDMLAKDSGFGKKIFDGSFVAGLIEVSNKYLFNGQLFGLIGL